MKLKKLAFASAIALTLLGTSPGWAETSTVKGQFILDRTEIEAGGIVNLALLGLNNNGEVDRFGEQQGAIIMAVVNSVKGKVIGGSDHPGELPNTPVMHGQFASSVRYVKLEQGNGRVHIQYPPGASGEDTITVTLQERVANSEGGVNFNEIARATKTVNITPPDKDPKGLYISGFTPAPADPRGVEDKNHADGIWGEMTAGFPGAQVIVHAKNKSASGEVTVTIGDFSFTSDMMQGEAIVTLDGSVTEAGVHYIEATFEDFDGDSVDLIYADQVKVYSTGTPRQISLEANKTQVVKPADSLYSSANSMCASTSLVCQGVSVHAYLLDEYGNKTSNREGGDIKISVSDANGVFSDTALDLYFPATPGKEYTKSAASSDPILGNKAGEMIKIGESALVASAVDNIGQPISTINPSEPLTIRVVPDSLIASPVMGFHTTDMKMAGTEFPAFVVEVVDATGTPRTLVEPGTVTITSPKDEQVNVNRKSDGSNVVDALFKTITTNETAREPAHYLIGDKAGKYGQVVVMAGGIIRAAATKVELQNAHGHVVSKINPGPLSPEKKYTTWIPEVAFKMFDSFGNKVTGNPITKDITGEFTVSSSNGEAVQVGGTSGVPGRNMGHYAKVVYDAEGLKKFSGQDAIAVNFTKPGLGDSQLIINSDVPPLQQLEDIVSYIEQNTIPVNSEVALTVLALDQDGEVFTDSDPTKNTVVKVQFNGTEEDSIDPTVAEIRWENGVAREIHVANGQSLNFSETHGRKVFVVSAGPVEGQFTLTFKDAKNEVTETRTFQVTKDLQQECKENNFQACTDTSSPTCGGVGGYYHKDKETPACMNLPTIEDPGATSINPDGSVDESEAVFRGGFSVEGGEFDNPSVIDGIDKPFLIAAVIKADPAHIGEEVDIIVLAGTTDEADATPPYAKFPWVIFDEGEGLEPYTGDPADIKAFREGVNLAEYQSIKIFEWPQGAGTTGKASFIVGYRLSDGTLVFNSPFINGTVTE